MKNEFKSNRIKELLHHYLEEEYVDPVPDNRKKLIETILWDAEDYDSFDDVISIIEKNPDADFNDLWLMINDLYPELEIVDDDEISPDDEDYFSV